MFTESLGLVAGALVTCSMIPQLIRVYKLRSAREMREGTNLGICSVPGI